MKIKEIFKNTPYFVLQGNEDTFVTGICEDSRKCKEGNLFVCIRGECLDGHNYIENAIKSGAKTVVVEDLSKIVYLTNNDVLLILVDNTRKTYAHLCAAWFNNPAAKLITVGITGTKGKTSTAYMTKSIFEAAGWKTGLIGTVEIYDGAVSECNINTTPSAYDIQKWMSRMVENGCKAVVMEVSSQGMKHYRCDSIRFDIGAFTNLKPDHIGAGEHKDFLEYRACKKRLFKQCITGVFNADDEQVNRMQEGHTCRIREYSVLSNADYKISGIRKFHENNFAGMEFVFKGCTVRLPYPGMFNLYNALCAAVIATECNISEDDIKTGLENSKINGRCEWIPVSDRFLVMLDYAHNAMSLKVLLKTLKEYNHKRLVCVFGCGGNRSKLRRYEMGEVSGVYADYTIITSDNPRNEEPLEIIADIITGIEKTNGKYTVIADRAKAVGFAIKNACEGDLIVIAGKGHETYQEIKGVRYPMDDRKLIINAKEETKDNVCECNS